MTTVTIDLPDEMKAFVEAQAAERGYASAGEYLMTLVREAQLTQAKLNLETKLREALEEGPSTPMTREDWDSIEREAWERHRRDQSQI